MTTKHEQSAPLRPGMYAPILTFFDHAEALDLENQAKHAVHLASAGLVGLVAMGSNGEAVHLTSQEKVTVIECIRRALDDAGHVNVPIIAGCSAQSVLETVQLCSFAAGAGASHAIVLPPSYFRPAMTMEVVEAYFLAVADSSPIPILMYNYPGAVAGIDMDSDTMIRIAKHPNVVGAKFTCANVGKLSRVAEATNAITSKDAGSGFLATGGLADITVQTAVSGGSGIIAGSANVFPKLCARVWNLWAEGKLDEASALQKVVAKADAVLAKSVVPATKATLQHYRGYGGKPRRPLPPLEGNQAKYFVDGIAEAMKIEDSL